MAALDLYDEIGMYGITGAEFCKQIDGVTGDLQLNVNSPGGDVFDGIAIYNRLRNRPGKTTVVVDGLAASIASVIAMAASPGQLIVAPEATMMVHDAFGLCLGNAADMTAMAELLDRESGNLSSIYAARTGKGKAHWRQVMKAETWYVGGQEAVDAGLADRVQATGASWSGTSASAASGFRWSMDAFNAALNGTKPRGVRPDGRPAGNDRMRALEAYQRLRERRYGRPPAREMVHNSAAGLSPMTRRMFGLDR